MKIKNLYYDDCINYGGHICLTIAMPKCSFKCGKELCQNSALAQSPTIEMDNEKIINNFLKSPLMDAICFQGLEPFDSWEELKTFIKHFRKVSQAPIVIYTGYNKEEVEEKISLLYQFKPIIIKFGRFIPGQEPHYDNVLNVKLASNNQYAEEL